MCESPLAAGMMGGFNSVRVAFEYGTSHTAGVATIAASTEDPINDELCDFHACRSAAD